MSLKRRIALFSCICGGCYVGFYNPKQLEANFKAFWHSTPKLTTGFVRLGFTMKPEQPPLPEKRRIPPSGKNAKSSTQIPAASGNAVKTAYKAARQPSVKTRNPRG